MKRIAIIAAVALLTSGALFAQGMSSQGLNDRPGPGWGPMGGIDWKLGTSVNIEDKKMTGQLVLNERLEPVLRADGVDYILAIPGRQGALLNVKNGDTLTVEGLVVTVKSDASVLPTIHAIKATIAGKEIDLRPHRVAQRGWGGNDRGPMGYGPRD